MAETRREGILRKPFYVGAYQPIGIPYWVELEGYEQMEKCTKPYMFAVMRIMGRDPKTLGAVFADQHDMIFAPRIRFWQGEERPSDAERKAFGWRNNSRAWAPLMEDCFDEKRYREYLKTGRTVW